MTRLHRLVAVLLAGLAVMLASPVALAGSQPSYGVVGYSLDSQITSARNALREGRKALAEAMRKADTLKRQAERTTDLAKKLTLLQEVVAILRTATQLKAQIAALDASLEKLEIRREALLTAQRQAEEERARRAAAAAAAEAARIAEAARQAEASLVPASLPSVPKPSLEAIAPALHQATLESSWRTLGTQAELLGHLRKIVKGLDAMRSVSDPASIAAESLVAKEAIKASVDIWFARNPSDNLLNAALVKSLVDTGFALLNVGVSTDRASSAADFVAGKALEIMEEVAYLRAEQLDLVSYSIQSASYFTQLQELGLAGMSDIVEKYAEDTRALSASLSSDKNIFGKFADGTLWHGDTSRKLSLVADIVALRSAELAGRSTAALRQSISDDVESFGKEAALATVAHYRAFARSVADALEVEASF